MQPPHGTHAARHPTPHPQLARTRHHVLAATTARYNLPPLGTQPRTLRCARHMQLRRGKGLARAVMRTLLSSLHADATRHATLCATAENRAACRSYEAVGFTLIDECAELIVRPG